MRATGLVGVLALAMLSVAGCGSGSRLVVHSCQAPSHYYSLGEVARAFSAHGLPLGLAHDSAHDRGAIARAMRRGEYHELYTEAGHVVVLVSERSAPPLIYKLVLNCGSGQDSTHTWVLDNVRVSVDGHHLLLAKQAKAAMVALEGKT